MPNVNAVINEQIRRLARREITSHTKSVKKATSHYRSAIAGLRKQLAEVTRRLARVERHQPTQATAAPEALEGARFRAIGVKAHRAKLGLSADAYGKLAGVSGLTIYNWESGKVRPRKEALTNWLAIRSLGKREALQRLGLGGPKASGSGTNAQAGRRRARGSFKQTGEQAILSLLQGGRSLVTSQINEAWRKEGRGGTADVLLGRMVRDKKLARTKVDGQRGSAYSVR